MGYVEENDAVFHKCQSDVKEVLGTIAQRYIGANPAHPYVYRLFSKDSFTRTHDYRYVMNVEDRWDSIHNGDFVYAWAKLWSDQSVELNFAINCFSPVRIYMNGECVFTSNISDEMAPERKNPFRAAVQKGWNHVILQFEKTANGCGGIFGTGSYKNFPLHFISPTKERDGQEGWIYSEPTTASVEQVMAEGLLENGSLISWHPNLKWDEDAAARGVFDRLFGTEPGREAIAWTRVHSMSPQELTSRWQGTHDGAICILVNGNKVYECKEEHGEFQIEIPLRFGDNELVVRSACRGGKWGFKLMLEPMAEEASLSMAAPFQVEGLTDHWLYLGTFEEGKAPKPEELRKRNQVFDDGKEGTYWRADQRNTWVRPYLENALFAKWNYPLGVTLYGLLQTGAALEREDYISYVLKHIEQSASFDEYALWDAGQYGAPGVNNQLALIDSLDDCGSFGATMLAALGYGDVDGAATTAARIADYMAHVQDRLPSGALYRVRGSVDFMKDTLWCDDLYMSVPFLCRYSAFAQDDAYLNDAVRQILLYKEYLYMPEQQIMSHVYDFKSNRPTLVPWGRGNGWVLFSLAELLDALPAKHEQREQLLIFYRQLCEGYLRLQGSGGLWHQVLTDPESYEETSCTSMFLYAFAKGIQNGWLPEKEAPAYVQAVLKGWTGLTKTSIDKFGNIYGVCRGSGYSFSGRYYKDDLSWLLNDTHGIGIVMLAGVEVMKLQRRLSAR
ncbi:glycoside hydrolase family 88/105 protein [Paenibacillus hexagrammi]|uniref:Glycoside hydrolase family 88 protein n=1 Tax=Paenibacillus hexagrammi TaxID=2908839 RepID=A0ABY3SLF5_9BACL|nr:glycoside hydrolase family 88 protein [Paenibacillus sp. YPD9-1]UJF34898.1 glycoside hydrolase family 88 protein [Paenibacillus sp. YPD9-1]